MADEPGIGDLQQWRRINQDHVELSFEPIQQIAKAGTEEHRLVRPLSAGQNPDIGDLRVLHGYGTPVFQRLLQTSAIIDFENAMQSPLSNVAINEQYPSINAGECNSHIAYDRSLTFICMST